MGTIKIETSIGAFGMRFPFYVYQILIVADGFFFFGCVCVCGFHCFRII